MADDFLSQDAIDDLIGQIDDGGGGSMGGDLMMSDDLGGGMSGGGGPAAAPKARGYDFARASKFSQDQKRTIEMIHDNFARLFSSMLSAKIRTLTRLKVVSVEEVTYQDFISTVSRPSIIGVFSMPPMTGTAVLDISPAVGFTLMDRLLGGSGDGGDDATREMTEIETQIMESVFMDALNFIKESWAPVAIVSPKLELLESNPDFVQIVPQSEMIILINLEAEIGTQTGRINLAIPYLMLEGVLGKLSIQQWFSTYRRAALPDSSLKVEERLSKTHVDVIARLGSTTLTLRDFLELEDGDVLQIMKKVSDEVDIVIGDKVKFLGRPGVVGKRLAVKATQVVTERREEEE